MTDGQTAQKPDTTRLKTLAIRSCIGVKFTHRTTPTLMAMFRDLSYRFFLSSALQVSVWLFQSKGLCDT